MDVAPLLGDLVLPAAAPVVLARAGCALVARARRSSLAAGTPPPSAQATGAALALAIAAGFTLALHRGGLRPALPLESSSSAWQWVFWLAPAAAFVGLVEPRLRVSGPALVAVRIVAAFGVAWLVLTGLSSRWVSETERVARAALSAVLVGAVWSALASRDESRGRALLASTAAATAGAAFALLRVARSATMAHAMAALSVAVAVGALAAPASARDRLLRVAAPLVALVVGSLTVAGFPLHFGADGVHPRLVCASLLAVSPLGGLLAPRASRSLPAIAIAVAAALALVAAAVLASGADDVLEAAPDGY